MSDDAGRPTRCAGGQALRVDSDYRPESSHTWARSGPKRFDRRRCANQLITQEMCKTARKAPRPSSLRQHEMTRRVGRRRNWMNMRDMGRAAVRTPDEVVARISERDRGGLPNDCGGCTLLPRPPRLRARLPRRDSWCSSTRPRLNKASHAVQRRFSCAPFALAELIPQIEAPLSPSIERSRPFRHGFSNSARLRSAASGVLRTEGCMRWESGLAMARAAIRRRWNATVSASRGEAACPKGG